MKRWRFVPLVLLMGLAAASVAAQQPVERYFPETGQWVRGRFLAYWNTHRGLAQQGYPLTNEFSEVSTMDGATYTVQYFERAVLEYHPENAGTPYEVLLSLVGVDAYRTKYPQGAPGQRPHPAGRYFPETGKRLGGSFLEYWDRNGGLAQQGYPISDEFTEVSALDGKPYTVQYFERAVFEYHPENKGTAYEVLLAQLGTYRQQARYPVHVTPLPSPTFNYYGGPPTPGPGTPWPTVPLSPSVPPATWTPRPTGTPPTPGPALAIPTARPGYEQTGLYGSDQYLIWTESRPGVAGSMDVVGLNLATGRRITVAEGAGDQRALAVDGAAVVWQQDVVMDTSRCVLADSLYRKTLPDGPPILIARNETFVSSYAAMVREAVAWVAHDCDGAGRVRLWTGGPVQRVWDSGDPISPPALSDRYVAWTDVYAGRLGIYNRATGQISEVIARDMGAPALHGDTLFWSNGTLQYLRLDTGAGGVIMEGARAPVVYGNTLLWRAAGGLWGARLPDLTPTRLMQDCDLSGSCELTVAGGWLIWGQRGVWQSARLDGLFARPPTP